MTAEELVQVLETAGLKAYCKSSQQVVVSCPFAVLGGHKNKVDRHPSLAFLADFNGAIWHCWSCGASGRIQQFLERLKIDLGWGVEKACELLHKLLLHDPAILAHGIPPYESHFKKKSYPYYIFPETWIAPFTGLCPKQVLERGVSLKTAKKFEVGLDRISHRSVFPVRNASHQLVGAVGGKLRGRQGLKYVNFWSDIHGACGFPVRNQYCDSCGREVISGIVDGFRKSQTLYGEQFAAKKKFSTIVVVEGIFDELKMTEALEGIDAFPVAVFGSRVSFQQAEKIIHLAGERVIAFFDCDEAGRTADKFLQQMIHRRVRYYSVRYPDGSEGQDPGSLPGELALEMVQQAKMVI